MAFCIYHQYSDRGNKPEVIYIGDDKAAAFDALWKFFDTGDTQNGAELHMMEAPTEYMEQQPSKESGNG